MHPNAPLHSWIPTMNSHTPLVLQSRGRISDWCFTISYSVPSQACLNGHGESVPSQACLNGHGESVWYFQLQNSIRITTCLNESGIEWACWYLASSNWPTRKANIFQAEFESGWRGYQLFPSLTSQTRLNWNITPTTYLCLWGNWNLMDGLTGDLLLCCKNKPHCQCSHFCTL